MCGDCVGCQILPVKYHVDGFCQILFLTCHSRDIFLRVRCDFGGMSFWTHDILRCHLSCVGSALLLQVSLDQRTDLDYAVRLLALPQRRETCELKCGEMTVNTM